MFIFARLFPLVPMKKSYMTGLFWLSLIQLSPAQTLRNPVDYVNVFAGTSNSRWMLFPGVTLPFGMVKLSPDNQENVWNGGYEYTIGSISGFSHLHAMGLSGVSLMPVVGKLELYPGQPKTFPGTADGPFGTMWTAGYRSRYDKASEKASPGYYSVHLSDYNTTVELSATTRTGWMRCTFPESDEAHVFLDFQFPAEEQSQIQAVVAERVGEREIRGYIRQKGQYADDYTVYFVTQLNKPLASVSSWQAESYTGDVTNYGTQWRRKPVIQNNITRFRGKNDCGLMLNFPTTNEKVVIRTGISLVSTEQAALNLTTESGPFGWDFDAVAAQARQTWNALLSRAEVTSRSEDDKTKFYTCLYRSYSGKSILSDVNGQYTDACEQTGQLKAPADAVYSADGAWGTQWDLTPLWTLLTPDRANSWVNALLELADRGGWLPEAPTGLEYAPIMGSQHHKALIVSSYQKGIRGFDAERAWRAIRHDLTTPGGPHPCGGYAGNRQLTAYDHYGYVPEEDGAVSNTLEYAYDDYVAAEFAKALGKTTDESFFRLRSQRYRNVFDPTTKYIRRKHRDGSWVADFDPFRFGTTGGWNGPGYMEGNAWQFTFFVPHDVPGLVGLLGRSLFNQRLEEGFAKGHVDLGNQPNMQAPFLFNYSGKPWLTQKYSRYVLDTFYNTSPLQGWVGEEDEGQLSALYVLMAMGLFQMDGGVATDPYYDLSSPIFDRVVLHLDKTYYGGNTFTIETINNAPGNVYIQSAVLNGKPLNQPRLYHRDLVKGGTLTIVLGNKPNERWGN